MLSLSKLRIKSLGNSAEPDLTALEQSDHIQRDLPGKLVTDRFIIDFNR